MNKLNQVVWTVAAAVASAFALSAAQAGTMNHDALRAEAAVQTQAVNQAVAFAPFAEPQLLQRDDTYYGASVIDSERRDHAAHLQAVLAAGVADDAARNERASRHDEVVTQAHAGLVESQLAAQYAAYQASQATQQAAR